MSIWDKIKDTASSVGDTIVSGWDALGETEANLTVGIYNKFIENQENYEKNVKAGDKIIDTLQPEWWQKGINYISNIGDKIGFGDYNERVKEVGKEFITEMDSRMPKKLLNNGITSVDMAHYLTNPSVVPKNKRNYLSQFYDLNSVSKFTPKEIEKLNIISPQDINTFGLSADKGDIETKKYIQDETNKTGYKIANLVKQGIINKDKASELLKPVKQINNSLYEIKKWTKSNPDALNVKDYEGKTLQDYYNEYDDLRKQYLDTYVKKIKEYKGDKEKLENNEELSKIGNEISNIKGILQTRMSLNSLETTNPITNPLEFLDRAYTTLTSYSKVGLGTAGRGLEDLYNRTYGSLIGGHLEQGMGFQQDINKDGYLDKATNLATDIASSLPTAYIGMKSFGKGSNILTTVAKNVNANSIIAGVFNTIFDPGVNKTTAYLDMMTGPISDAVFFGLGRVAGAGVRSLVKMKYGDVINKATKAIDNEEVVNVIRKGMGDIEGIKTTNQVARSSVKKTIDDYNRIMNDFIKKSEGLAKRGSNIITSPLVREAKKQIINSFADVLEKQGLTKQAKMLKDLTHSGGSINKTFNELRNGIEQASNKISEESSKFVDNPAKLAQLIKSDITLPAMVAKGITKDGIKSEKIVPDTVLEAQAKVVNQVGTAQNIADATQYVANKVDKVLKKSLKKEGGISFKEFKQSIMKAIEEDLGKLNPEARAMYERVLKGFEGIHDDVVKDIHIRKGLYGHKNGGLYFKKLKGGKPIGGAFNKDESAIYIKYLEHQFKNNQQGFFITLFHELTHSIWKGDFKKSLGRKEGIVVENMYNKFKEAMDSSILNIVSERDKNILIKMKDDKDEFLAYIMGELIVGGDSKTLHRVTGILRDAGVKNVDIKKFKKALNTYLTTRFGGNKILGEIKYAVDYSTAVEEGAKILDRDLKDLFKTKDIKSVGDVIHGMDEGELKEVMKKLGIKVPEEILDNMSLKELQNTLTYQIHMNLSGIGGFKASAVWNAIGDIIEFDKNFSKLPNLSYLEGILKKEDVDLLKGLPKAIAEGNTINYIKKFKGKVSSKVQNILLNLLTTSPDINKDYINVISALWGKLTTPIKEVGKSKKNLFNRFLEEVGSKYDINDMYRGINELLSGAGYKLLKKGNAKEVERAIINGEDIQKFIDSGDIVKTDYKISVDDMIQYNYSRFNPKVAYNLNKLIDSKNLLNNKLFKKYNITKKDLQAVGIKPEEIRTVINQGLPDEYSKVEAYKEGNKIIYTDRSGNIWRVDKKGNKFLIDNSSQIVIKGLVDDRSSRGLLLIKDLEEGYETFIGLKEKIKGCQ